MFCTRSFEVFARLGFGQGDTLIPTTQMAEPHEAAAAAILRAATQRCGIGERFSDKNDVVLAVETLVGLQVRTRFAQE